MAYEFPLFDPFVKPQHYYEEESVRRFRTDTSQHEQGVPWQRLRHFRAATKSFAEYLPRKCVNLSLTICSR